MFTTLLMKEIHETIINFRFLISALLCIVLIPLGLFVTLREYEQRMDSYRNTEALYLERSGGGIHSNFPAEGHRPPSPLSVFSVGLEYFFPNKVITARNGEYTITDDAGVDNPLSLMFGKIDFQFIVTFVLSLMALIFMFSTISGEKETGTLRLLISNPVPRWKIILAKITGGYLVFLIPFIASLVIVLIMLNLSGTFPLFSPGMLPKVLFIFGMSFVFLLAMFNLGSFVSALTSRSITSMVTLLIVWTILVLVIPKVSPMLAEIIYPIKSQQVIKFEKQNARVGLEQDRDTILQQLYERLLAEEGVDGNVQGPDTSGGRQEAMDRYDEEKIPIETEYAERISSEIRKINEDYTSRMNSQLSIARNLSRLSPVSCFTYILSEIAGTGLLEIGNFSATAQRFQEQVKQEVYDRFSLKVYATSTGASAFSTTNDDFDPETASVPQMTGYQPISLSMALGTVWVDILLLFLYTCLFFAAGFVSFLRYDVR